MHRFSLPALSNTVRRLGAVLVSCLAVATLASCGGGTQSKKFVPESFVVFGDEFALINANGSRYGVNSYVSGSAEPFDCNAQLNWILIFANSVNFKFSTECPGWLGLGTKTAVMQANDPVDVSFNPAVSTSVDTAVANAGANAVLTKINNNLGLLNDKTLVTVTVGRADIVKAYWTYLQTPDDATLSTLKLQLKTLGGAFSAGLRPIVNSGARMMVVLTPSLDESPLAKLDSANLVRNKAALKALGGAFNDGLEFALSTNGYTGQQVALVDVPRLLTTIVPNYATFGLTDVDTTACPAPFSDAPLCVYSTLPDTNVLATHLWVDATHLNTSITSSISSAVSAAFLNHPF